MGTDENLNEVSGLFTSEMGMRESVLWSVFPTYTSSVFARTRLFSVILHPCKFIDITQPSFHRWRSQSKLHHVAFKRKAWGSMRIHVVSCVVPLNDRQITIPLSGFTVPFIIGGARISLPPDLFKIDILRQDCFVFSFFTQSSFFTCCVLRLESLDIIFQQTQWDM